MIKKFKHIIKERYSGHQMISLAKAISKTKAKIVDWGERKDPEPYITFEIKENYPIFKPQLESSGFIVEELRKLKDAKKGVSE